MARIALAAAGLAALAGCGGDGDGDLPWHAQRASEVRELEFFQDVEVVEMTRAEFQAQAAESADQLEDAQLTELAETYGRLGFFPLDADLRPILAGSSSDWVGATYSARTKAITLVEDDAGDVEDATQVHEFVHALQDQHFDLIAYDGSTSDEFLARRGVVEGDAVLAEYRFRAQEEHDGEVNGWDWPTGLANWQAWSADLLATSPYPVYFDAYPSFVYPFGLEYTAANLLGPDFRAPPPHDWGLEDELFAERPPATVQQVMRLENGPLELVGLDAVPPALEGRLEADTWDTLGGWFIYLLFYPQIGGEYPADTVAEWNGDRVLFVRDPMRGGAAATVWASAWKDRTAADRVATMLDVLYGRVPDPEVPQAGVANDGETLWIEERENRVVAIKNLDPQLAAAMADAAFAPPAERRTRPSRPPLGLRIRELAR